MTQPTAIVGPDDIRGCTNTSGGAIVKGTILKLKASPTYEREVDVEATNTGAIYGVAMHDADDDAAVDVQIRGQALVLAGGTIAAGVRVMPTTGGKSLTATAGNSVLGLAVTAGAADELHEVELNGPGGCEMPG